MSIDTAPRFKFGKNWQSYLNTHFSEEKLAISQKWLLDFLQRDSLEGLRIIDIGSGSGIHSYAAWRAGAAQVFSFDYDEDSVAATRSVRDQAGSPANWTVAQGSILDDGYISSLGTFDLVYSWGVLHHTGDQWKAIRNAMRLMGADAEAYIALYDSDMFLKPGPDYWLDIKKTYNRASEFTKRRMELEYIWKTLMGGKLSNIGKLARMNRDYKKDRGMSLMVDIKDWLGGWPMEFSSMGDVLDLCKTEFGASLVNVSTGQANTEYLFARGRKIPASGALGDAIVVPNSIKDLPADRPVYLYGMGVLGDLLKAEIDRHPEIHIGGYVDRRRTGSIDGKAIMTPDEMFATVERDVPVLVTSMVFGEIAKMLWQNGFTAIHNTYPIMVNRFRAT